MKTDETHCKNNEKPINAKTMKKPMQTDEKHCKKQ
jgi:hypothetical protein